MKSPAETAEAHSEPNEDEGSIDASRDVETAETVPSEEGSDTARDRDSGDGDPEAQAGQDGADGADGSASDQRRRRSPRRWIAALVLVGVLAVAGYEGWLLYQHHQRDVAAAQALDAAEKFTLALTTIDPNAVDTNITEVIDGSTGEFKNLYQQSSAQLRQVLIDNKAAAKGIVIDSAVKSAAKDKVEVVLFVDQAVSNATAPGPQLDRSRVVMTMEKVDGRWLASKVDLP